MKLNYTVPTTVYLNHEENKHSNRGADGQAHSGDGVYQPKCVDPQVGTHVQEVLSIQENTRVSNDRW